MRSKTSRLFTLRLALGLALAIPAALAPNANAAPASEDAHTDQNHDLATRVQSGFMKFNDSLNAYLRCRKEPGNEKPEKLAANCPFDPNQLRQTIPDLGVPPRSAEPAAVTANIPWIRARLLASLDDAIRAWKITLGSELPKTESLQEILNAAEELRKDLAYVKISRAAGASTIKNAQQVADQGQEKNDELVTELGEGQRISSLLDLLNSRIARGETPEARGLKEIPTHGAFPLFLPNGYCSDKIPKAYEDPTQDLEPYQAQGKPGALLKDIEAARLSSELKKLAPNLELSLTALESMVDLYQRHWPEFRFEEQQQLREVQNKLRLAEEQRVRLSEFCTHLVRAVTDSRNKALANPLVKTLLAKPNQPAVQGAQ